MSYFKYIFRAISYGVMAGVVALILFPQLRGDEGSFFDLFDPEPKKPAPLSYAQAVKVASPAVVNLYSHEIINSNRVTRRNTISTKLGSGVIMDSQGFIVTNYHVIRNAAQIIVLLQSGEDYAAELIGYDLVTDLAVLKVDAVNLPVIPQELNMEPYVGDVVLAIGNPLNLGQTVTQGIISAVGRSGLSATSHLEFLQMDAAINEGNSGGALINSNGDLVGINSRKVDKEELNVQGIFLAVPYKLVFKVMTEIIENGRVVRGWLGISTIEYMENAKGFLIGDVVVNGPAQQGGLLKGDIVHKIDGIEITSIAQALDIVAETRPGTVLNFEVYRSNTNKNLAITIGAFPI